MTWELHSCVEKNHSIYKLIHNPQNPKVQGFGIFHPLQWLASLFLHNGNWFTYPQTSIYSDNRWLSFLSLLVLHLTIIYALLINEYFLYESLLKKTTFFLLIIWLLFFQMLQLFSLKQNSLFYLFYIGPFDEATRIEVFVISITWNNLSLFQSFWFGYFNQCFSQYLFSFQMRCFFFILQQVISLCKVISLFFKLQYFSILSLELLFELSLCPIRHYIFRHWLTQAWHFP